MRKPKHREPVPINKIEVPIKHFNLRVILLAIAIAIAAVAIGFGIYYALHKEPGWRTVEVTVDRPNCSKDFVLTYHFGSSGTNATTEYKKVAAVYTEAVVEAYRLFNNEADGSELARVAQRPNTEVKLDPDLYQALKLLEESGNRSIYLAPVYVEYQRVFSAEDAVNAERFDPNLNQEAKDYVNQITAFTNDPQMIGLELLGDNRVCLTVSQEYLAFAQENEITTFLDFGWMKNAFIIDYLAQALLDVGFTDGFIASYDGFTRNLDKSGRTYSQNLFNRQDNDIFMPAAMDYTGPMSMVFLRNFPLSSADKWHYYAYQHGSITTAMVDPADGLSKSAVNNLLVYSKDQGCAQLLMKAAPVFVAESFDEQVLQDLTGQKIYSVWFQNGELVSTDANISVRTAEESE